MSSVGCLFAEARLSILDIWRDASFHSASFLFENNELRIIRKYM